MSAPECCACEGHAECAHVCGVDPFDDFALPPPAEFFRGATIVIADGTALSVAPLHYPEGTPR